MYGISLVIPNDFSRDLIDSRLVARGTRHGKKKVTVDGGPKLFLGRGLPHGKKLRRPIIGCLDSGGSLDSNHGCVKV